MDVDLQLDPETEAALLELYRKRWIMEELEAAKEQSAIAQQIGMEAKAIDGVGEKHMQVHASSYHYWGQRLGYDAWNDKGFMKWFLNRAPECKVKCTGGTRPQILAGWEDSRNKRFSKRYEIK